MFGVDYTSHGNATLLKQKGAGFACRYIAPVGAQYDWKRLTKAEAAELKAAGLAVVTVFESSAQRALGGFAAGVQDGKAAVAELIRCGAPKDAPCYFAVDFDEAPGQNAALFAYFQGVRSVFKPAGRKVGGYGDYYVLKRLFDAGLIDYGWQAYAWSGGLWDPRAQLRQYRNGQRFAGLSVDYDASTKADFGQWGGARRLPKLPPRWSVTAYADDGTVIKTWTALRFPSNLLRKWGVAKHKPRRIVQTRIDTPPPPPPVPPVVSPFPLPLIFTAQGFQTGGEYEGSVAPLIAHLKAWAAKSVAVQIGAGVAPETISRLPAAITALRQAGFFVVCWGVADGDTQAQLAGLKPDGAMFQIEGPDQYATAKAALATVGTLPHAVTTTYASLEHGEWKQLPGAPACFVECYRADSPLHADIRFMLAGGVNYGIPAAKLIPVVGVWKGEQPTDYKGVPHRAWAAWIDEEATDTQRAAWSQS